MAVTLQVLNVHVKVTYLGQVMAGVMVQTTTKVVGLTVVTAVQVTV